MVADKYVFREVETLRNSQELVLMNMGRYIGLALAVTSTLAIGMPPEFTQLKGAHADKTTLARH